MNQKKLEEAMFGAGCFWGIQYNFDKLEGVLETKVGYSGGHTESPSYKDVCSDTTGHAEVVHLKFDPDKISYESILKAFWEMHDPTTLNRQGPDVGSQYRSIIFYYDDIQKKLAEESKENLDKSGKYSNKIITEISKAGNFWLAEEYHQKYSEKTGLKICH